MTIKQLRDKRNRVRRARARQYRKWRKTRKHGHLKAFRKRRDQVKDLNQQIEKREKERGRNRVYSREDWDAADPHGSYTRQSRLIAGVQHHTALPALPAKATVEQECARMRQIQASHLSQGWTDIGYAYVIFPSRRIYEGRPAEYVGAHTLGHNTGYAGWALDGNYETSRPTKAAIASCHRVRKLMGVADKPLFGHYQLNPTACPGRNLKPYLGKEI